MSETYIRRAPKFTVFMVVGAVIGALIGIVFAVNSPADSNYSFVSVLAFFGMIGAIPGLGCGALAAIYFDKRSLKDIQ